MLLWLPFVTMAQISTQRELNLKGRITKVIYTHYEIEDSFGYSVNKKISRETYLFNNKGQTNTYNFYSFKRKLIKPQEETTTFAYVDGKVSDVVTKSKYGLSRRVHLDYENGLVKCKYFYGNTSSNKTTYVYDAKDRLEMSCYFENNGASNCHMFLYDSSGKLIEENDVNKNKDEYDKIPTTKYLYDDSDNIQEMEIWYKEDTNPYEKTVYHYDEHANVIELETYTLSGDDQKVYKEKEGLDDDMFNYKAILSYDNRGNIIKQVIKKKVLEDYKPCSFYTAEIFYQ